MHRDLVSRLIIFPLLISISLSAHAEQSQDFGDYVVHFNALNTNLLSPKVAKEYGITRSNQRAMLNVAVQRKKLGTTVQPINAQVTASATNLAGQTKELRMREIKEPYAIYYISEFPISNEETLNFDLSIEPQGSDIEPLSVRFRQQFFVP